MSDPIDTMVEKLRMSWRGGDRDDRVRSWQKMASSTWGFPRRPLAHRRRRDVREQQRVQAAGRRKRKPSRRWGDWVDDGWIPGDVGDPENDPADDEAWLAALPADVRADYLAGAWTGDRELIPAGFLHHLRSGPYGAGFAAGGALDTMVPGPWLAEALSTGTAAGHAELGESELIGVLCAWRRMSSWAVAGEAAAAIALARRRAAQAAHDGKKYLDEHVNDELAAALTLTGRSADRLLSLASGLDRLADVHAALERGTH